MRTTSKAFSLPAHAMACAPVSNVRLIPTSGDRADGAVAHTSANDRAVHAVAEATALCLQTLLAPGEA